MIFIKQVDKVMKQRGTQILQHFLNSHKVEDCVQGDGFDKADYLCEEMSNFSYLYMTYYHFIISLIYRQQAHGQSVQQIKGELKFSMVDDVLDNYVELEKAYIRNALKSSKEEIEICTILDRSTKRVSFLYKFQALTTLNHDAVAKILSYVLPACKELA